MPAALRLKVALATFPSGLEEPHAWPQASASSLKQPRRNENPGPAFSRDRDRGSRSADLPLRALRTEDPHVVVRGQVRAPPLPQVEPLPAAPGARGPELDEQPARHVPHPAHAPERTPTWVP